MNLAGAEGSWLIEFPGSDVAPIDVVGGKGHSLMQLAAGGFRVPAGLILSRHFFRPWLDQIKHSTIWTELNSATPGQWPGVCLALKRLALELPMDTAQGIELGRVQSILSSRRGSGLFAVRSSSPQEDLLGVSFAGGYETRLGVTLDGIEDAVRGCFASMFDERVLAYKAARGLDRQQADMAVVIQDQIDSEVAGVAFSLNPLTNDADEAVIDASWGQGESVVSGSVTPDHWLLDKPNRRVIATELGDKRTSRWLKPNGGVIERYGYRTTDACLTDHQLHELLDLICRVEAWYQHPVDIEWAMADGTIHVLQARPVTAFVPVPITLQTEPGERRRLYLDVALSSGFTINAPISTMGLDVFRRMGNDLARIALGARGKLPDRPDTLLSFDGNRMYLDLSNALWLGGPRLLAEKMRVADASVADALVDLAPGAYRSAKRPAWASMRHLWRVPLIWWRLRRLIGHTLLPFVAPDTVHRRMRAQMSVLEDDLMSEVDSSLDLDKFWAKYVTLRLRTVMEVSMAAVGPGVMAVAAFKWLAKAVTGQDTARSDSLDRGFEGNVVVAMGIAMHELADHLDTLQAADVEKLAEQLHAGKGSPAFRECWSRFLSRFGKRGAMEMDIAHPRYADEPTVALKHIADIHMAQVRFDPASAARHQVDSRRAAVAEILSRSGPIRRALLSRLNRIVEHFSGCRDTPKHHLLGVLHAWRKRVMVEGGRLKEQGRLDATTDVFDLTIDELVAAGRDESMDVRTLGAKRRQDRYRLANQVINFPALIDSRGRILRPPRGPAREGVFTGLGLSAGVVVGQVRVMRSPQDGAIAKGEILVAYTTDPGWTPVFTHASGIVLEIGGVLQHGAVVARELGLPCVAGIVGITTMLRDGQRIEINGADGTVRLLDQVLEKR